MHIFLRICVLHHWNHFFLIPNAQYPAQRVTFFKSATNLKLIIWCKHFINFLSIINYFHYAKEYSIKFTKVKSYWTNVSHRHLVEKKRSFRIFLPVWNSFITKNAIWIYEFSLYWSGYSQPRLYTSSSKQVKLYRLNLYFMSVNLRYALFWSHCHYL